MAIIKQKLWEVGANVIAIRRRQDELWNDYQQRIGQRRLYTWWLAVLTLAVSALGALLVYYHH